MAQLEVGNYSSIMVFRAGAEHSRRGSAPNIKSETKRSGNKRAMSAPPLPPKGEFIPINDVLVACDLLKLWFRRMPEPVTGFDLYSDCVSAGRRDDPRAAEVSASVSHFFPLNSSFSTDYIE